MTDACSWAQPIYVSQHDELTPETARQILSHNETGDAVCGWRDAQGED